MAKKSEFEIGDFVKNLALNSKEYKIKIGDFYIKELTETGIYLDFNLDNAKLFSSDEVEKIIAEIKKTNIKIKYEVLKIKYEKVEGRF